MKIFICDDDVLILKKMEDLIKGYFDSAHLKSPKITGYTSGEALLADTDEKDILFLDMELPGMSGIHIGATMKKLYPNLIIIVVSSHSSYLDDAMRFQVFRYLSKPIDEQRFLRNLEDALHLYHSISYKIPIETRHGVTIVQASSIVAIEAHGKKTIVHTTSDDFESTQTMQRWLYLLPQNTFCQTHRSFIVNFEHVTDFDNTLIHLADGQLCAYLTRRKYSDFKKAYLLYLKCTR